MDAAIETSSAAAAEPGRERKGLLWYDTALLSVLLPLWLVLFLAGTLVDSAPFRSRFADFEGGALDSLVNGLVVMSTYTLLNIGILCVIASVLGSIGATARLGPDEDRSLAEGPGVSSPRSAAVLRGFIVYLTLISGLIVFADSPTEPTEIQYVKLAGVLSVVSFIVSYKPTLFAALLERGARMLSDR